MSGPPTRLEEVADQAVRDLVELDEQVAAGEISPAAAQALRRRYETAATTAWANVEAAATDAAPPTRSRPPRSRAVVLAYGVTAAIALVAAMILLPGSVLQRPEGGFVTGNEVTQGADQAPALDPDAPPSNAQLEDVVAANPEVVGMRLALADRYLAEGDVASALRHYEQALRREPDNAQALSRSGWALAQDGQPDLGMTLVQQALEIEPQQQDALWFQANIAMTLDDPETASDSLRQLSQQPMTPDVAAQVGQLQGTVQEKLGGNR